MLTEYAFHRKDVLDSLRKAINSDRTNDYDGKSAICRIIFPMYAKKGRLEYQHNLWLIDERLAYFDCVLFATDSQKNESVLTLGEPIAVSCGTGNDKERESVAILEVCRPMRDDYSASENPILQMLDYVDKICSNQTKDKNGREIKVGANTQFYLYAVCDITPKLRRVAENYDFIETPDKLGMYRYHDKKRAYIEILSFDKLINDADKRNKILFDKLGI